MIAKLLKFMQIDDATKASAATLSALLAPRIDGIIDQFYNKVQDFDISPHVTSQTVVALKVRQKQHWIELFRSQFEEDYLRNVRRIAMRHRDIELSPMWYVAGYMTLKLSFIEVILRSAHPTEIKGQLVKTLDKYIAIDMALALSVYDTVVLD